MSHGYLVDTEYSWNDRKRVPITPVSVPMA